MLRPPTSSLGLGKLRFGGLEVAKHNQCRSDNGRICRRSLTINLDLLVEVFARRRHFSVLFSGDRLNWRCTASDADAPGAEIFDCSQALLDTTLQLHRAFLFPAAHWRDYSASVPIPDHYEKPGRCRVLRGAGVQRRPISFVLKIISKIIKARGQVGMSCRQTFTINLDRLSNSVSASPSLRHIGGSSQTVQISRQFRMHGRKRLAIDVQRLARCRLCSGSLFTKLKTVARSFRTAAFDVVFSACARC